MRLQKNPQTQQATPQSSSCLVLILSPAPPPVFTLTALSSSEQLLRVGGHLRLLTEPFHMPLPLPGMPFPAFPPSMHLSLPGQLKCCFLGDTFPGFPSPPSWYSIMEEVLASPLGWPGHFIALSLSTCSHVPGLLLPPSRATLGPVVSPLCPWHPAWLLTQGERAGVPST